MPFERLSRYKHLIWDWNGTLLNDVVLTHSVLNSQLKKAKMDEVCLDTYRSKQRFPIRDFYVDMGFNFETHPFESIADQFLQEYEDRLDKEAQLFEDRPDLLRSLQKSGSKHYLLSAAPHDHLVDIVTRHHLIDFFERVSGSENNHAAGKLERAHKLIIEAGIEISSCALVGDTDHDLEVGLALGVDVWLVTEGHQSRERLEAKHKSIL